MNSALPPADARYPSEPQLSGGRSPLRLKVSLVNGRAQVRVRDLPAGILPRGKPAVDRPLDAEGERIRNPGKEVLAGLGKVQLFGRAPGPWTIAWRDDDASPRRRVMRSAWRKASAFFDAKVLELTNHASGVRQLSPVDGASYLRTLDIIAPTGKPLELVAAEYVEGFQILKGTATVPAACRSHMEHQPAGTIVKTVSELVTLLLAQQKKDGAGAKGLRTLAHQVDAFAKKFDAPLHLVRAPEMNTWLRSLDVGLRTRKNYRAAIVQLGKFALANNFVSRTWADELKALDKIKPLPTEATLWTQEQMGRLLRHCPDNLRPLLVLMSFGGLRHEEMSPEAKDDALLDWSNIDLEKGLIRVPKTVAKTKRMRLIKMQPNLIAWLRPLARRSGPICELKCTGDALYRLGIRAGVPWVKNACRNSFVSYRLAQTNDLALVAKEAGNSPRIIAEEYLELATQEQGASWFQIFPKVEEDIIRLPLFAWGKRA